MDSPQAPTSSTTSPSSFAAPEGAGSLPPRTPAELLELSQVDLYQLFRRSSPGKTPVGRGRGTPIFFPGTRVTKLAAKVFCATVWQGKVFQPESADLKNLISLLGIPAIRARVYREQSWFDGQECIVLDYSQTSRICGWVRDEIREVHPGLYLGLVYGLGRFFGGRRLLDVAFSLSFSPEPGTSKVLPAKRGPVKRGPVKRGPAAGGNEMHLDGLRGWAPRILGGIRLFNGAVALLAPGFAARRLGADPGANPAPIYPLRMFGVRTVLLGAELLLPQDERGRARALRNGIVIHASDTLAAGLGGLRGQLPPRTAALLIGISSVNTALAIIGSRRHARARRANAG